MGNVKRIRAIKAIPASGCSKLFFYVYETTEIFVLVTAGETTTLLLLLPNTQTMDISLVTEAIKKVETLSLHSSPYTPDHISFVFLTSLLPPIHSILKLHFETRSHKAKKGYKETMCGFESYVAVVSEFLNYDTWICTTHLYS